MMKKLISAAAGAGLVLSMAGAVLANDRHHRSEGGIDIDQDGRLVQDVEQRATAGGRHSDVVQLADLYADQNAAYVLGRTHRTSVEIDQDGFLKQEVDQNVGSSSRHHRRGSSGEGDVSQSAFVDGLQNYAQVGGSL